MMSIYDLQNDSFMYPVAEILPCGLVNTEKECILPMLVLLCLECAYGLQSSVLDSTNGALWPRDSRTIQSSSFIISPGYSPQKAASYRQSRPDAVRIYTQRRLILSAFIDLPRVALL